MAWTWRDLVPSSEVIQSVQGVEADLLRRRRTGAVGGAIAIMAAVAQLLAAAGSREYLGALRDALRSLFSLDWTRLAATSVSSAENLLAVLGTLMVVAGVGVYLLYRWTGVLRREAEEPFRYTFWVERFQMVADTPGDRFKVDRLDQFALLHHDLRQRLSQRIARLSLRQVAGGVDGADPGAAKPENPRSLTSHIQVGGDYTVRETGEGWVLQVMPRVRIGPAERPEALTYPVEFQLDREDGAGSGVGSDRPPDGPEAPGRRSADRRRRRKPADEPAAPSARASDSTLTAEQYLQIIERVYSLVATELYRQIKIDLRDKVRLFPWPYLRAAALFFEAKDFERSNTIDAYDHAAELYRRAKRYFDTVNLQPVSRWLVRMPFLWRIERRFLHMEARARIGLARCLIYRRIMSPLTGRAHRSPFELPELVGRAIENATALYNRCVAPEWRIRTALPPGAGFGDRAGGGRRDAGEGGDDRYRTTMAFLTYPEDSLLRRNRRTFELIREAVFDAYTVAALAYIELEAIERAEWCLRRAQALHPSRAAQHGLWQLARAGLEPRLELRIPRLRTLTELEPGLEIAQYQLARDEDRRLRLRHLLTPERAEPVAREYRKVLKINPGNIAALAALGYLHWLVGEADRARRAFRLGQDVRAIVAEAFVGELSYGLARLELEEGRFNRSYELYSQAIAADPGVATVRNPGDYRGTGGYFDLMSPLMLARYRRLPEALKRPDAADRDGKAVSDATWLGLEAFVFNDYGNACLHAWLRYGDSAALDDAIESFERAIKSDPVNGIAVYNLSTAVGQRRGLFRSSERLLAQARDLLPGWTALQAEAAINPPRQLRRRLANERQESERARRALDEEIQRLERELDQARRPAGERLGARHLAGGTPARSGTKPARASAIGSDPKSLATPWAVPTPGQDVSLLADVTVADVWRQARLRQQLEEAKQRRRDFETAQQERERAWPRMESELRAAVSAARETITAGSKISAIFADVTSGDPARLLDASVVWHRFDDADLRALMALAEMEVSSARDETSHDPAALVGFLTGIRDRFYPEDFEVNLVLSELHEDLQGRQGNGAAEANRTVLDAHLRMCRTLKRFVEEDPAHYLALTWLLAFWRERRVVDEALDREAVERYLERAVAIQPESGAARLRAQMLLEDGMDRRKRALDSSASPEDRLRGIRTAARILHEAAELLRSTGVEPDRTHRSLEDRVGAEQWLAATSGVWALDVRPASSPLGVIVADDLAPEFQAEGWLGAHAEQRIAMWRHELKQRLGIPIRPVRVLSQSDASQGAYILLVHEIPSEVETLSLTHRLCPLPPDELKPLGIDAADAIHPLTDEVVSWVGRRDWQQVDEAGLELWNVADYPLRRLERLIGERLDDFIGHQETGELLSDLEPQVREPIERSGISEFVQVLRRLASEGVTPTPFAEIAEVYISARADGSPPARIVERLRAIPAVRRGLPGNDGRYARFALSARAEAELAQAIDGEDPSAALRLPSGRYRRALRSVQEIAASRPLVALVVERATLRPWLRALVRDRLPRVPVLSRAELLDDPGAGELEEFDLWPGAPAP